MKVGGDASTPSYSGPSGRSRIGNYTSSPHHADLDITSPAQSWLHERGQQSTVPVAKRPPVIWIHIHNCAGSFICGVAGVQGEKLTGASNCNWPHDYRAWHPYIQTHCE